jgi:SAM-dependent methyltransferase
MLVIFGYYLLLFIELLFFASFSVYVIFLIYSHIKGSPYVPTKTKETLFILKEAHLKKKQIFYELGCGDGRVVRYAVKDYKVKGFGVDINPLLILYSKFLCFLQKIKGIMFIREDIMKIDLENANVVYLFLMPEFLKRLIPKFEKELKKNTIVISHGFKIIDWQKKLYKTIQHTPFPTYFYRI